MHTPVNWMAQPESGFVRNEEKKRKIEHTHTQYGENIQMNILVW